MRADVAAPGASDPNPTARRPVASHLPLTAGPRVARVSVHLTSLVREGIPPRAGLLCSAHLLLDPAHFLFFLEVISFPEESVFGTLL